MALGTKRPMCREKCIGKGIKNNVKTRTKRILNVFISLFTNFRIHISPKKKKKKM